VRGTPRVSSDLERFIDGIAIILFLVYILVSPNSGKEHKVHKKMQRSKENASTRKLAMEACNSSEEGDQS